MLSIWVLGWMLAFSGYMLLPRQGANPGSCGLREGIAVLNADFLWPEATYLIQN